MSSRPPSDRGLPAPPPSDRGPRAPRPPDDEDDELPLDDPTASGDDDPSEDDETDEALRRPESWPDDHDEPTWPEGLLDPDLEELPRLDGAEDDEREDDVELPEPDDEVPLEDDLDDLDAPDDTDVPVIPWQFEVELDGRPVAARADPGRERTTWLRPTGVAEERAVAVLVAGKLVRLVVACAAADQELLLVGRDLLSGRFLLRP